MKLIVVGASGGTGRAAVIQAAEAGHAVTAVVRRSRSVRLPSRGVRVIEADAFDAKSVADAVRGHEAALSILGTRPWRFTDVCSRGTANIVAGLRAHGVRRLVVLSSLGVGDSEQRLGWFSRKVMIPLLLRRELEDKGQMEAVVRGSGLDWIIVRLAASVLTNDAARGRWLVAVDGLVQSRSLPRADLAAFCLAQLASDDYLCQSPLVA
jgi:uncharacterized protein YbjT (DUF2867 family)